MAMNALLDTSLLSDAGEFRRAGNFSSIMMAAKREAGKSALRHRVQTAGFNTLCPGVPPGIDFNLKSIWINAASRLLVNSNFLFHAAVSAYQIPIQSRAAITADEDLRYWCACSVSISLV